MKIENLEGDIDMVIVGYGVVTIQADGLCFMVEKGRKNAFSIHSTHSVIIVNRRSNLTPYWGSILQAE
jgi:hypothetical protein